MKISKHASKRARQRGIKFDYFDIILEYAEYIKELPGKAFLLRIRKRDKQRVIKNIQICINSVKTQSNIRKRDKDIFIKSFKKFMNSFEKISRKQFVVDQNMDTIITMY